MSTAIASKTLTHISVTTVQVTDQNEALRFYTEALGFEKRLDMDIGGGMRWVTVAPAGSSTEITLVSGYDSGMPLGTYTGIIFETEDIDAAHGELSGRGVRFTEAPVRHSWGGWAQFADPDGNTFGIHSNQFEA